MKKILFILTILLPFTVFSQEVLTGLHVNPVLKQNKTNLSKKAKTKNAKSKVHYATLPFMDDFAYNTIYPDTSFWLDNYVFVNNEYCTRPLTIGVATFDALNQIGEVYPQANPTGFYADSLTSVPIRLDSTFKNGKPSLIEIKDSIYFTFYYQPQGTGNSPGTDDSLFLQFYSPKDTTWQWIWSAKGSSLKDFKNDKKNLYYYVDTNFTDFRKVMIKFRDTKYLQKGFQFRFINTETVANNYLYLGAGNVNIWNIDYISIDTNHIKNINRFPDVAFNKEPTTLLKNYQSMPWKQFVANSSVEMLKQTEYNYHNYSYPESNNHLLNFAQYFNITNLTTKIEVFNPYPSGSSINLKPLVDSIFIPDLNNYVFQSEKRKYPDFEVKAWILSRTINDTNQFNDTAKFTQRFYNYYAYDDGNPEAGYGLSVANGLIAYKFNLNTPTDTLQSVQIFFNSTLGNTNHLPFYIKVWNDLNGVPGKVIYPPNNENYDAVFPDDSLGFDVFNTFILKDPLILKSKTFYVGMEQTTSDILNIGFDMNNNHQDKIFINYNGNWYNSMYNGSLMICPVLGSEKTAHVNVSELLTPNSELILFPNPLTGNTLNIKLSGINKQNSYTIQIFNSIGAKIYSSGYSEKITLPILSKGLYFVRLYSASENKTITKKLLINN